MGGKPGGGGDFERDAGQVLRKGVVQFDREARALANLQVGGDVCDRLFREFSPALFGKTGQGSVPEEDSCESREECANHGQ